MTRNGYLMMPGTARKLLLGLFAAVILLAGVGVKDAEATTARGALVTNIVSATFGSVGGGTFEVSYAVTATFLVESPGLWFWKEVSPSCLMPDATWQGCQMPGGCVTFKLWVWNYSSVMTAYSLTIKDILPDNMTYKGLSFAAWNGGTGGTWNESYSTTDVAPYAAGEAADGTGVALYMKWVLSQLGPTQSAYVRFEACIL